MVSRLKQTNHRITPQRLAVLEILASSHNHPSVDMIYEQLRDRFPTMSIATVYKTIAMLKEINEVLELGFPDGSNRYDGTKPFSHPHVVCTQCKAIMDPDLSLVQDLTREVVKQTGFTITGIRLDFFGVCDKCQKRT